ncbi:MAG TPA: ATP synthase F1 subunit gamma [Verrucomicrobiae bacterium]|nr:ATP synthase F1 subunit gamma [Verrucomicrobiae bacterium]
MASIRQLKTRIRSVKNTRQITKAMELVAASKMRRAQDAAQATSLYARSAFELLTHLAARDVTDDHPLFTQREIKTRLIVVVTSDKGLAGAYNANVFKRYVQLLKADDAAGIRNETLAIGRKGAQFVTRLKDTEIVGAYEGLPDQPNGAEVRAIMATILDKFTSGQVDAVDVIYTEYINSITQEVTSKRLLPAGFMEVPVSVEVAQARFEPSAREVLEGATRRLVEAQIFQALLDATASEHSMRMLAMKNATDNANELVDDLTLAMNKVRQASITQEIAEISSGAEAVS